MEATMDLDELLNELDIDDIEHEGAALTQYIDDCGGFDIIDFGGVSSVPSECTDAAHDYLSKVLEFLEPTKVVAYVKDSKVWLYAIDFHYTLESLEIDTTE